MSSFSSTTACGSRRASYFVYQRRHFLHKMLFTLRFWHTSICCIPQNTQVCHSVLQPFLGMACWWLPKDRFLFAVWCCIADIILELRHQLLCRHIWILFHPLSMEAHLLVHNAAHFPEVCRAAQLNKPNASALRIVSSMSRPVSY